jgi:general secretion pathway protein B
VESEVVAEPNAEQAEAAPEKPQEPAAPVEARIPEIWELPGTVQQRLKGLKVNIHVYNELPEERFVIIDMRRYREGDSLGRPGLRLDRITRDGVVIDYGDGLVRL